VIVMKQYLISVYQPDGKTLPPDELAKVMHDANAWNEQLKGRRVGLLGGAASGQHGDRAALQGR